MFFLAKNPYKYLTKPIKVYIIVVLCINTKTKTDAIVAWKEKGVSCCKIPTADIAVFTFELRVEIVVGVAVCYVITN